MAKTFEQFIEHDLAGIEAIDPRWLFGRRGKVVIAAASKPLADALIDHRLEAFRRDHPDAAKPSAYHWFDSIGFKRVWPQIQAAHIVATNDSNLVLHLSKQRSTTLILVMDSDSLVVSCLTHPRH